MESKSAVFGCCLLLLLGWAGCECGEDLLLTSATIHGQLLDSGTGAPVEGAYVAIEKGGHYVPITDPSRGSPAYQYGALTDASGRFVNIVAGGVIGVHTFHEGYFYGTKMVEVTADPTVFTVTTTPLPPNTPEPTLTNAKADPSMVAPGARFSLSVTAVTGVSTDPLSDEIIAVEPSTGWAGELDPPTPGVPGKGYPDGEYKRMITAPSSPGTYTYGLAVTTEGCVTGKPTTVTVTVQ